MFLILMIGAVLFLTIWNVLQVRELQWQYADLCRKMDQAESDSDDLVERIERLEAEVLDWDQDD